MIIFSVSMIALVVMVAAVAEKVRRLCRKYEALERNRYTIRLHGALNQYEEERQHENNLQS